MLRSGPESTFRMTHNLGYLLVQNVLVAALIGHDGFGS